MTEVIQHFYYLLLFPKTRKPLEMATLQTGLNAESTRESE